MTGYRAFPDALNLSRSLSHLPKNRRGSSLCVKMKSPSGLYLRPTPLKRAKMVLNPRSINPLLVVLVLLCIVTGCRKHPDKQVQKMAVQTDTAKSIDSLRSRDDAAYIAMVRADNETD